MEAALRKADYDRYLSQLFAPAPPRPHLIALYAFNQEVAKTAWSVSQPMAGLIRLQWWRDAIGEVYAGQPRRHETLLAFADAVSAHDLPRTLIDAMIDAREADLEETPFAGLTELIAYADATSGHLMRLSARILGAGGGIDKAAGEAGTAYALSGLLRALPHHSVRRHLVLPLDLVHAAGISPEDIFAGKTSGVSAVIGRIAQEARAHLDMARRERVPRGFLPALLPAATVPASLRVLERPGFDPFHDSADVPIHRRQLAMLGAVLTRRI